jgi:ribonucleoside-diphosphate reductase alpha chain
MAALAVKKVNNKKGEFMENISFEPQTVKENCLEYFNGDELATSVVMNKYLLKNDVGEFLECGPDDMLRNRITKEFSRIENNYQNSLSEETIYESFKDFKYIVPQGSPLFGIGNNEQIVSVGNCFVVGQPTDSYGGILQKDQQLAQIMKRRGGVGVDISTIRPTGTKVKNAARTSDGISCFMERYSNTTKEVAQNGRRGALMISIDSRHPDLDKFIDIKRDKTRVTGANISIKWHDDVLAKIKEDGEYTLRYPVESSVEDAQVTKTVKIKELWDKFIESNWESAEPGCFFWDTITSQSISDCYAEKGFKTITSNPCGEILMSAYNSCILMLVNLKSFVDNPFTDNARINWKKFEKHMRIATRLIDDMIDLELEKVDQIISKIKTDPEDEDVKSEELSLWEKIKYYYEQGRRTGLGVTALGDMLASLGIQYGSDEALKITEKVFKKFHLYTYDENAELAKERGAFPAWDWELEKDSHYIKILPKETQEKIKKYGRRNIASNTCAPAGSVSILTQTTSGIEPLFMRSYNRNRKMTTEEINSGMKEAYTDSDGIKWTSYEVFHHGLEEWKQLNPNVPIEESPYANSEAGELDWRFRVKLQGIVQKYIDHSISSTTNLHKDISKEEVSELYMLAHENKCKGITIYRDGSRMGVLTSKEETNEEEKVIVDNHAPKREQVLPCEIHYSNIKNIESGEVDQWIFMVGVLEGRPYEIFGGKRTNIEIPKKYKNGWIVKNGRNENGIRTYDLYLGTLEESDERMIIKDIANEFSTSASSYTRIISTLLRHGVPIKTICEQLHKDSGSDMWTFEKAVSRTIKKYIKDGEKANGTCPSCGHGELQYRDGCVICPSCGDGKCS